MTDEKSNEVDLDAAREARLREAGREAPKLRFAGKVYDLPVELSFRVAMMMDGGVDNTGMLGIIEALLGEEQYAEFIKADPSMNDIIALFRGLLPLYGVAEGESSASSTSSEETTTP